MTMKKKWKKKHVWRQPFQFHVGGLKVSKCCTWLLHHRHRVCLKYSPPSCELEERERNKRREKKKERTAGEDSPRNRKIHDGAKGERGRNRIAGDERHRVGKGSSRHCHRAPSLPASEARRTCQNIWEERFGSVRFGRQAKDHGSINQQSRRRNKKWREKHKNKEKRKLGRVRQWFANAKTTD